MIDKMVQFSGSCFYPDRLRIRTFSSALSVFTSTSFRHPGAASIAAKILFNDFLTLMSVIFHHFFFQITYRLFHRDNSGQAKKADCIIIFYPISKSQLSGKGKGIDGKNRISFFLYGSDHSVRQMPSQFFMAPYTIQQKNTFYF